MLKKNPKERITAEQALSHPYFEEMNEKEDLIDNRAANDYP